MKITDKETTVVLADIEKLRIIRFAPYEANVTPRAKPVTLEEMKFPKKRHGLSGRFPQGSSVSEIAGMSRGESHDEKTEYKKRRIKLIAQKITELLMREETSVWCFAAPVAINKQIVKLIPSSLRSSMISNLHSDLTHLELEEIQKRFLSDTDKI